jgi:uncharacterized tellurite resistance protein B-like protein
VDKNGVVVSPHVIESFFALLVELSGSDNDIAAEEASSIVSLLREHFEEAEEVIPQLVRNSIRLRQESGGIDVLVQPLNDNYSDVQRRMLLAMIWRIVLADGEIDPRERRFALQMRNRLRLSEDDERVAKEMAEREVL